MKERVMSIGSMTGTDGNRALHNQYSNTSLQTVLNNTRLWTLPPSENVFISGTCNVQNSTQAKVTTLKCCS